MYMYIQYVHVHVRMYSVQFGRYVVYNCMVTHYITRSRDSFIGPTASAIITCSCIFVLRCIEVPVLLINRTQVGSFCLIVLAHNLSLLDGLLCNSLINNYVFMNQSV